MIRLHVVAEGQSEETFVQRVLAPHLGRLGIATACRCVTTRRRRGRRAFRGGLRSYEQVKRDLELWMKEDPNQDPRFTTFLDLYGLPAGFPGLEKARSFRDPREKVRSIEAAMAEDVGDWRFVPYIQLQEFEALVLADPSMLGREFPAHTPEIQSLVNLVSGYTSPEDIDDGAETAPSKRIIEKIPAYQGRKAAVGPLVTETIGLETLRERCPHFDGWLTRLEGLAGHKEHFE